jgi:hypothetical protein
MSGLIKNVANKAWQVKSRSKPPFAQFKLNLDNIPDADKAGKFAQIFFNNKNQTVNKWLHYLPIYDRIFGNYSNTPIKFLEIGVFRGGSMNLWREFFGPQATIFGIDINPDCAQYDGISGQVRIGSQDDPDFLERVVAEMGGIDIVLDDGSHIASHQRASFEILFPLLKEGGLYVIEDLHTSYWPSFEGGLGRAGTGIEFLKEKIDVMHSHYFKQGSNRSEKMAPIHSVQFFDSVAVIEKQVQKPRGFVMVPPPE